MSGHTSFVKLLTQPHKRWHEFGVRSFAVLYKRSRFSHWPFRLRMAWQRATRGHSDEQLWNLNYTLAALTVAGCRAMREYGHGYPSEFSEEHGHGGGWKKWEGILLAIEEGFQAYLDEDGFFHEKPEQEAKFKKAMDLYAEWFGGLWD